MRATGGVEFISAVDGEGRPIAGVRLDAGSGMWDNLSDVNAKREMVPVRTDAILQKLSKLPIWTWSYKAQDASVRHIGPTAQDFKNAFGLGRDDTHIGTLDADGVALAAIQELYKILIAQAERIERLERELASKK